MTEERKPGRHIDWEKVARAQGRKLHAVIHVPGVRDALSELTWEDEPTTPANGEQMEVVAWLDPVAGEIPLVRLSDAQAAIAAKDAYILTAIAEMEDHKKGYEARIAELEGALMPFSLLADYYDQNGADDEPAEAIVPNIGDLRRARAALHPEKEGE